MRKNIFILIIFTIVVSACGLPTTSEPSPTPEEDLFKTGTVEGRICFPSNYIPEMILYLENVNTQETTIVPILETQADFSAPVPPGTYLAYAWLPDLSRGGTYSQAVPCGLTVECKDHSLIEFEVSTGEITPDINVCDWYGSPKDIPLPPNAD